jgi:tetratricopeptide (TPR) repeat protein
VQAIASRLSGGFNAVVIGRVASHWVGLLVATALASMAVAALAEDGDDAKQCFEAKEAPSQKIEHCSHAIEATTSTDVHSNLLTQRGLAWFAKGEAERAGADLDEAIRLNGNSFWAHNSRAVVRMQNGDYDRAIADYDDAIRLKPGYAFALANRGNAWLAKGDADRAVSDFDAAIRLTPPQIELAYVGRGKAWMAKGDFDRAVADFDAALKANPKYANALSGRGFAKFCQGRFDAAAEDFALERKLRPDSESAIELFLAQARGGRDAKIALAESTKSADPQQGQAPAVLLFLDQITPEQVLQAVSDKNPKFQRDRSCSANFQVGEWYVLKSKVEQARTHLTRATQLCDKSLPEFAAASAELARLK